MSVLQRQGFPGLRELSVIECLSREGQLYSHKQTECFPSPDLSPFQFLGFFEYASPQAFSFVRLSPLRVSVTSRLTLFFGDLQNIAGLSLFRFRCPGFASRECLEHQTSSNPTFKWTNENRSHLHLRQFWQDQVHVLVHVLLEVNVVTAVESLVEQETHLVFTLRLQGHDIKSIICELDYTCLSSCHKRRSIPRQD